MCKPHKHQRAKGRLVFQTWQERRARVSEREQLAEAAVRRR